MPPRDEAIENIQKIIREKRQGIRPDILEKAQKAALRQLQENTPKSSQPVDPQTDTVPYDTESAREAVALFLKNHSDPENFCLRLSTQLAGKEWDK